MSAPRIDLRADLHGHVTDYTCDLDRLWFEAHPGADVYHRPAVDHEWCDRTLGGPGCTLVVEEPPEPPPGLPRPSEAGLCWYLLVEVTQLRPGTRTRRPWWLLAPCEEVAA